MYLIVLERGVTRKNIKESKMCLINNQKHVFCSKSNEVTWGSNSHWEWHPLSPVCQKKKMGNCIITRLWKYEEIQQQQQQKVLTHLFDKVLEKSVKNKELTWWVKNNDQKEDIYGINSYFLTLLWESGFFNSSVSLLSSDSCFFSSEFSPLSSESCFLKLSFSFFSSERCLMQAEEGDLIKEVLLCVTTKLWFPVGHLYACSVTSLRCLSIVEAFFLKWAVTLSICALWKLAIWKVWRCHCWVYRHYKMIWLKWVMNKTFNQVVHASKAC